jgi:hypothetical protein
VGNVAQEIDMIGLRRAAPDRQGNLMPCTAKGQVRPPLQCENTKIVASDPFGGGSAQSMFIKLFARRHRRAFLQQYPPSVDT